MLKRYNKFSSRAAELVQHPLILPLYLPGLLFSVAQALLLPVLPLYARDFNASYLWVGLIIAGDGLGLLFGDIPAGMIMQRLDRRQGMLLGLSIVGASTLMLFWAGSLPQVLLFRILSGMGAALYNVARHTYIADTVTVARRGQSVALLGATFRMGRMLGPAIGGSLAAAVGLRAPFLVYGLVCGLAVLIVYFSNRSSRFDPEQALQVSNRTADGRQVPLSPRRESLSPREYLQRYLRSLRSYAHIAAAPGAGQYLLQMLRSGPPAILPLYGAAVLGLNVQQIGFLFSISSLVDMTLFYPTGLIMDRMGRKWAIVPSALVMTLGLALVPLTHSFGTLLAAAVLNGFGNGLGSGVMMTLGADLAPSMGRGEFLGLWSLIGDAGTSSGPLIVGALTDLLALGPATWAIAGAGMAAAAVFGLLVPETLQRAPVASPAD